MKAKILIFILLLSTLAMARSQITQEGKQQKVFISVGNKLGTDETNADCYATITDSQNTQLIGQSPMYYDGGSLYYFLTDKNWKRGRYTSSFICTSSDGSKSGILDFNIEPFISDILHEDQNEEARESWFEKFTSLIPFNLGSSFAVFKNIFATALDGFLLVPKLFITVFNYFKWTISHMYIILLLFEVYVLSSAIAEKNLIDQIALFLQKNIYAIEFIITMSIKILTFAVRIVMGLLTAVTNLVPF